METKANESDRRLNICLGKLLDIEANKPRPVEPINPRANLSKKEEASVRKLFEKHGKQFVELMRIEAQHGKTTIASPGVYYRVVGEDCKPKTEWRNV